MVHTTLTSRPFSRNSRPLELLINVNKLRVARPGLENNKMHCISAISSSCIRVKLLWSLKVRQNEEGIQIFKESKHD